MKWNETKLKAASVCLCRICITLVLTALSPCTSCACVHGVFFAARRSIDGKLVAHFWLIALWWFPHMYTQHINYTNVSCSICENVLNVSILFRFKMSKRRNCILIYNAPRRIQMGDIIDRRASARTDFDLLAFGISIFKARNTLYRGQTQITLDGIRLFFFRKRK